MVIEKRKGMKASVVLAVMVVLIAAALVPAVTAEKLTVTPDDNVAGAITGYTVDVTTTDGYNGTVDIYVTIPAGFGVVAPTFEDFDEWGDPPLLAEVEIYDDTDPINPYATAKCTANKINPETKIDVHITKGGDTADYTIDANYNPGGGAQVGPSTVGGMLIKAVLKLPEGTEDGYLIANLTLPDGVTLKDLSMDTEPYVQNPQEPGSYPIEWSLNDKEQPTPSPVNLVSPTELPALTPIGLIALVGLLSVVLVGATVRRKK